MRNGSHVKHGYSNEFLDSDRVANVYFTSDVDAKSRMNVEVHCLLVIGYWLYGYYNITWL